MAITEINNATALSSGAELWILPGSEKSRWFKTIDWYLNFIIVRSEAQKLRPLPESLVKILEDHKMPQNFYSPKPEPYTLIAPHGRIPCERLVKINDSDNWSEQAQTVAQNLKSETVRVFLPAGESKDFKWSDKIQWQIVNDEIG